MSTILITGANRGIGLELTRQWADEGHRVFATCRHPESAAELNELAGDRVTVHRLDVTEPGQLGQLEDELGDTAIDILVNNAGVYGPRDRQSFGSLDYDDWADVLRVNVFGPVRVTEALLPRVERSEGKKIATVSSRMGSIADSSGGSYIYRSSKAAVNCVMHGLAEELGGRGVVVLALHPGWVQTDMGGDSALITAEESARGLRRVIEGAGPSDSGRFLNWKGEELPW